MMTKMYDLSPTRHWYDLVVQRVCSKSVHTLGI